MSRPTRMGPHRPLIGANAERHTALWVNSGIDVQAFHCHNLAAVRKAAAWRMPGHFGIVSDDGHRLPSGGFGIAPRDVEAFLRVCHDAWVPYEHLSIPLSTRGESGARLAGRDTFPVAARATLDVLSGAGDPLASGGVLGLRGTRPTWNGETVHLVGASWYGALVARHVEVEAYLDTLHGYGLNLTRVWLVDQWTTLGAFGSSPGKTVGRTPFVGTYEGASYDLERLDDRFFEHLQRFVGLASERGIIVQVCLFDRAGLQHQGWPTADHPERWGHAWGSPYHRDNNRQDVFAIEKGGYPQRFLATEGPVAKLHGLVIDRVAESVRDARNVIVEIMNEPLDVWGRQTIDWHRWVAKRLLAAWK